VNSRTSTIPEEVPCGGGDAESHPPPGESTRPTSPAKPPSCRPGALTRRPHLVHNENCWFIAAPATRSAEGLRRYQSPAQAAPAELEAARSSKPKPGTSCPMRLGFHPPHPGGMADNSPTFQRWVREFRGAQVPKGRLKPRAVRQPSLRDLSDCGGVFPTLKRWAIVACPSGTMAWRGFAAAGGAVLIALNLKPGKQ